MSFVPSESRPRSAKSLRKLETASRLFPSVQVDVLKDNRNSLHSVYIYRRRIFVHPLLQQNRSSIYLSNAGCVQYLFKKSCLFGTGSRIAFPKGVHDNSDSGHKENHGGNECATLNLSDLVRAESIKDQVVGVLQLFADGVL